MRGIAEALVSLQKLGNTAYIRRSIRFNCFNIEVKQLKEELQKMEEDLREWQQDIGHNRRKYYHLNYYTSEQLLLLRKELGKLNEDSTAELNVQVLYLLQSVCSCPTKVRILGALQKVEKTKQSESTSDEVLSEKINPEELPVLQKKVYDTLINEFSEMKTPNLVIAGINAVELNWNEEEHLEMYIRHVRGWCMEKESDYMGTGGRQSDIQTNSHKTLQGDFQVIQEEDPRVQVLVKEDHFTVAIAIAAVQRIAQHSPDTFNIADARKEAQLIECGLGDEPSEQRYHQGPFRLANSCSKSLLLETSSCIYL